jgi:heparosan-N-sulfate-glucuronate 5-epimerase
MRRLDRGKHIDVEAPRGYYIDLSAFADLPGPPGRLSSPSPPGTSYGRSPSPADIARYALGNLELYLGSGSAVRRDRFEAAARSLIEDIEVVPATFGGWAMHEPPRAYRGLLPSGWLSGGVQGECVSVLARAVSLMGTERALETARTAVAAFSTPVADGGLLREVGDEGGEGGLESLAFIEEYPIDGRPVLNLSGHVRALWGIHDYAAVADDSAAASLFERCVRGLEFELDRFDLGYWTRPDLDGAAELSSVTAIREHVLQMGVMYDLTGSEVFRAAARRWAGYVANWKTRSKVLLSRLAFSVARRPAPRS